MGFSTKGPGAGALADGDLLKAALDAIHKEDDLIGGRAVTRLVTQLTNDETGSIAVESTLGFGEFTDSEGDGRLLIGGELIDYTSRVKFEPFAFGGLTRGVGATEVKTHPVGTLIFDFARNSSAIDHTRRGLFVDFAVGEDLSVIARNLGLIECAGLDDATLRRIIKGIAYLPKQTRDAFRQALIALLDDVDGFTVTERTSSDPWKVFVEIDPGLSTDIRGRFLLNGGEPQLTTGAMTVDTTFPVIQSPLVAYPESASQAIEDRNKPNPSPPPTNIPFFDYPAGVAGSLQWSVYDDTPLTRRGFRDGLTNYATGGSAVGNTITLGSSPGGAGTAVIVDYTAFTAHYLANDETIRQDFANADHWAYLADPLLSAQCILDQIRAAGVKVILSTKL